MAHGLLRCFGSPLHLKNHYGVGYQLTIGKKLNVADMPSFEPTTVACVCFGEHGSTHEHITQSDSSTLRQIVQKHIPQSRLLTNNLTEMIFHLPRYSMHAFIKMLKKLDREIGRGKASSYGLSITTLDQVFIKVSSGVEPEPVVNLCTASVTDNKGSNVNDHSLLSYASNSSLDHTSPDIAKPDTSPLDMLVIRNMVEGNERALFWVQVKALFRKRLVIFRRDKKTVLCTVFVPLLVTLLGFLLTKIVTSVNGPSDLQLELDFLRFSGADLVPIVTNAGFASFLCHPGLCSVDKPLVENKIVNEAYAVCGYESRLVNSIQDLTPRSETCTLQQVSNIVSSMPEPVHAIAIDIQNVSEVSQFAFPSKF
jgi:hypothetical protein